MRLVAKDVSLSSEKRGWSVRIRNAHAFRYESEVRLAPGSERRESFVCEARMKRMNPKRSRVSLRTRAGQKFFRAHRPVFLTSPSVPEQWRHGNDVGAGAVDS